MAHLGILRDYQLSDYEDADIRARMCLSAMETEFRSS